MVWGGTFTTLWVHWQRCFWVPRSTGFYLLRPPTSQYMCPKWGIPGMLSTWGFQCENDDQRSTLGYYILLDSRLSLPKKYPVFRFIATFMWWNQSGHLGMVIFRTFFLANFKPPYFEPGMRFVVGLSTLIPSPANINHSPINHALVGYETRYPLVNLWKITILKGKSTIDGNFQ